MNEANSGGPAFPTDSERQNGPNSYHFEGMTLRDYFAAKAMAAIIVGNNANESVHTLGAARDAYRIADYMLAARSNEG